MRILVITNLYPPQHIGGYEIGCKDMVESLQQRGHAVEVLTSTYQVSRPQSQAGIHRLIEFTPTIQSIPGLRALPQIIKRETTSHRYMRQVCRRFQPDIVYFWNMSQISLSLVFLAEDMGLPTAFYVFDGWLSHWGSDSFCRTYLRPFVGLKARIIRKILFSVYAAFGLKTSKSAIRVNYAQFCSSYIKELTAEQGLPVTDNEIVQWGLSLEEFPLQADNFHQKKLLFVGRIVPNKGVHILLEAMNVLVNHYHHQDITLTVAGNFADKSYERQVKELIEKYHLGKFVNFPGAVSREQISELYAAHSIALFPSLWSEPFGISRLEAMASGLPVVGTMTGGSKEICLAERDALAYEGEDVSACAEQIHRLLTDADLYHKIRDAARQTVENRFSLDQVTSKVEQLLLQQIEIHVPFSDHASIRQNAW